LYGRVQCKDQFLSFFFLHPLNQGFYIQLIRADTVKRSEELAQPWKLGGRLRPMKPVGCAACRNTGYRGRAALYELMPITEPLKDAIHPTLDVARLTRQAMVEGMRPLRLAGLMKVAEGLTTLDEVLRCTPQWVSSRAA